MSAALKTVDGGPVAPRHFLEVMDFDTATLRRMLDLAARHPKVVLGVQGAGLLLGLRLTDAVSNGEM